MFDGGIFCADGTTFFGRARHDTIALSERLNNQQAESGALHDVPPSPAITGKAIRAKEPAEPKIPSRAPWGRSPTTLENNPSTCHRGRAVFWFLKPRFLQGQLIEATQACLAFRRCGQPQSGDDG